MNEHTTPAWKVLLVAALIVAALGFASNGNGALPTWFVWLLGAVTGFAVAWQLTISK